jgi:hypothetical protein
MHGAGLVLVLRTACCWCWCHTPHCTLAWAWCEEKLISHFKNKHTPEHTGTTSQPLFFLKGVSGAL